MRDYTHVDELIKQEPPLSGRQIGTLTGINQSSVARRVRQLLTPAELERRSLMNNKHPISNDELDAAGIRRRLYNQRRNAGWSHDDALTRVLTSTYDADRPVYEIADHIRIRNLYRDGMSVAGLQRTFQHIKPKHLEDIVRGTNFIPSNT